MSREEKLFQLLLTIEEYERSIEKDLEQIIADANKLFAAAEQVGHSSSGSAFGYHSDLYYGNFDRPPSPDDVEWGGLHSQPGWHSRTFEDVQAVVQGMSGVSEAALNEYVEQIINRTRKVQDEMLATLSFVYKGAGMERETELLKKIEAYNWSNKPYNTLCNGAINSMPRVSRDSEAVYQGQKMPAYIRFEGIGYQAKAHTEDILFTPA